MKKNFCSIFSGIIFIPAYQLMTHIIRNGAFSCIDTPAFSHFAKENNICDSSLLP